MLAVSVLLGALAGCQGSDGVPSTSAPSSQARVVLDWDTATMTLPLDRYGATSREEIVLLAASNLVYARCATTDVAALAGQAARSAAMLQQSWMGEPDWRFGVWDAEWVATHGWMPSGSTVFEPGIGLEVSAQVEADCASQDDVVQLLPVTPDTITGDELSWTLAALRAQAYEAATGQADFEEAASARAECLHEAGYTTADAASDPLQLNDAYDESSPEAMLALGLVQAQCSDSTDAVQHLGDVVAAQEQHLVDAHEAELVALRAELDQRVAQAHAVLREAGLE